MTARQYHIIKRAMALAVVCSLVIACGGGRSAVKSSSAVADQLTAQYRAWKGVPYREGGMSRSGVDCSGFVHLTFKDRFGMTIPRTTAALASFGKEVRRSDLSPGDLVLFKTERKNRHVGIYYGGGRFLHASTSQGVTLSVMDNVYWAKRFWQARRVM